MFRGNPAILARPVIDRWNFQQAAKIRQNVTPQRTFSPRENGSAKVDVLIGASLAGLGAVGMRGCYGVNVEPYVQGNVKGKEFLYNELIPAGLGASVGVLATLLIFGGRAVVRKLTGIGEASGTFVLDTKALELQADHPPQGQEKPTIVDTPAKNGIRISSGQSIVTQEAYDETIATDSRGMQSPASVLKSGEFPPASLVSGTQQATNPLHRLGTADILLEDDQQLETRVAEIEDSIVNKIKDAYQKIKDKKKINYDESKPIGEVGNYTILSLLGQGGMGAVFLAKHKTLGFLRIIKACMIDDEKAVQRFEREAKTLARIKEAKGNEKNDNIIEVYDTFENFNVQNKTYRIGYVAEYVEGLDLGEIIRNAEPKLTPEEALVIGIRMLQALKTVHQRNIIHRDMKPANVMFTTDGTLKLIDFGLAKGLKGAPMLTENDTIVGSYSYLPPEMKDKQESIKGDIYSTGIVIYALLAGKPPRIISSAVELGKYLYSDDPAIPESGFAGMPEGFMVFLKKMTARDPKDRFQNCEAAINAAENLLKELV